MPVTTVRRARLAAGPFRRGLRRALRKRRGLTLACAARGFQRFTQPCVLLADSFEFVFESFLLALQVLAVLAQRVVASREVLQFAFESASLVSEAVVLTPQHLRRGGS